MTIVNAVLLLCALCFLPFAYGFDLALDQIGSQLERNFANRWQFGRFGTVVTLLPDALASDILKSSLYTVEVACLGLLCLVSWFTNVRFASLVSALAVIAFPFAAVNGFLSEGLPQIKILTTLCSIFGVAYLVISFRRKPAQRRIVQTVMAFAIVLTIWTIGGLMIIEMYLQSMTMDRGW
ncbi:hypothetical protein [Planctomycetes bacterium CA13]|uniref:hypothetical protein n=1 Tax=Novipirellula herctigrandis TaxID=2527986 RepID=UPI0011B35B64